jgi:hypothetical protein
LSDEKLKAKIHELDHAHAHHQEVSTYVSIQLRALPKGANTYHIYSGLSGMKYKEDAVADYAHIVPYLVAYRRSPVRSTNNEAKDKDGNVLPLSGP